MHFVHDRRPPTRSTLPSVAGQAADHQLGVQSELWTPEFWQISQTSPLLPCSHAPLLIVLALFSLTTLTACTNSSADTEPSETISNLPTLSTQSESSPQFLTPISSPLVPSPQLTPTSTLKAAPTGTPTPIPTPTPAPSLRQLTSGGCCVQPSFSFDGQQVLFIDKPGADTPSGIYGINLADPQPTPALVNRIIGFRNLDRNIVATLDGELVLFTNEVSGESWTVNTSGNWPSFSPDSRQIIWTASDQEGPYDRRQTDVWLANLPPLAGGAGGGRLVLSLYGGGLTGWFPDNQRILLIGRDNPNEEKQTLFVYDLVNNRRTNLFTHKRLRGGEISRGGSWIAFFLSFADEPAENGLWLISADGTTQRQLDLPRFGAYLWRDDNTLLFIPMRAPNEASMQLWAIDASTGQLQPLTDPASLSFSISNGDWEVSLDGRHIVFVSSADQNIWLITLP